MGNEVAVETEDLRRASRMLAEATEPLALSRARVSAAAGAVAGARVGSPLGSAALEFAHRWDAVLGATARSLDASAWLLDGAARSYVSTDRDGAAGLFRRPPLLPGTAPLAPP